MKISGIYKIQSISKPERIYLDASSDMRYSWLRHKENLKRGRHPNIALQLHVNLCGIKDLAFIIHENIIFTSHSEMVSILSSYIISEQPYFNITSDYEPGNSVLNYIEETSGELTPEQLAEIASQIDVSNKVDKVAGSSLLADTEAAKIHSPGSDNQDLSGLQPKETNKGLSTNDYTDAEETKLASIESGANNYTHPTNHPSSIITQDISNRFVSDTEKLTWDNKTTLTIVKADADIASAISLKHSNSPDHSHTNKSTLDAIQESLTTTLKTNYDTSYTHSQATHAPSNAQKNSDITKTEIEAKLIGEISTHTHAGGGSNIAEFAIMVQALTSSPTDGQTVYFGMLPKAPTTTANISKIYIRKTCTLKVAEIYCYSGTAGTNEAWSLYVRKNNTTDTLIATLSVSASERIFNNTGLSISLVAGDYLEIKGIQPTWGTNPLTTIYGGYLYFE